MSDAIIGGLTGLLISIIFIIILYLFLDYTKMRLIGFKVEGNNYWEIAFSEKELREKLDGRMAEVIMPAKPILVRWYRFWFPLKGRSI